VAVNDERPAPNPEATAAVRERFHTIERLVEILPAIQAVAASHDGVYLVGGAVRDVLLGKQSIDLDVMVEGDAIAVARELADALGGQWRGHEKFHTAVVEATGADGHGIRVDLASARTESYDAPGALPDVERSTLRHDLARRDFTINAMAASLRSDDLGATYDFYGGYRDLRQGTVRVLHDRSFVEDPTRLLRALRYEARFGFAMDSDTESLARGCIDEGLLAALSSTRVRDELIDLLAEERVTAALSRMAELGVDRALHPHVDARAAIAHVEAAAAAMQGPLAQARVPLVRLGCLCAGMAEQEVCEWLDRLKLARGDRDVVAAAVTHGPSIAMRMSGDVAPAPSEQHELVEGQPLEVLVMAIVFSAEPRLVADRLRTYLEQTHGVRLDITGDDLRRAGVPESPEIGAALKETLALKLDGVISGRDEELATALRILGRGSGGVP
jgi:tRNA nucleotidyltransferase (CCA-adding enzyme)